LPLVAPRRRFSPIANTGPLIVAQFPRAEHHRAQHDDKSFGEAIHGRGESLFDRASRVY
jgi:hypothetical protein